MTNQQLKAHCEDVIANQFGHWEDWVVDMAKEALAALTQPASPALKLPDEMYADHPRMRWVGMSELWGRIQGWNDCLDEVKRLNAPHTAPIEPICATGGAEWVKVSERMPLELSDEHISEVEVIVTDGTTVGTCEYRRGYLPRPWAEWSNYGDIDADEITHWQPMPSAPGA